MVAGGGGGGGHAASAAAHAKTGRGLSLARGGVDGSDAGDGGAGSASGSSSEGEEEEESQAAAVAVQQALLVFLPAPVALRAYSLAAPRTSGWSLTYDGSRFLLGKQMRPDALLVAAEPAAAPPSPAAPETFAPWLSAVARACFTAPYAVAFAYRFRRAITATNGITARFALDYAAQTPLLRLPHPAPLLAGGSIGGSAGFAAIAARASRPLLLVPTTLEGTALAAALAQLQAAQRAAAAAATAAGAASPPTPPLALTQVVDRFTLLDEPLLVCYEED